MPWNKSLTSHSAKWSSMFNTFFFYIPLTLISRHLCLLLTCFIHAMSCIVEFEDPTFELLWKNNSGDILLFCFFWNFSESELNAKTKEGWDAEDNRKTADIWMMASASCLLLSSVDILNPCYMLQRYWTYNRIWKITFAFATTFSIAVKK